MTKRNFRSLTTVVVYWFAILAGLALFTATRTDHVDLAGMWIGAIGGTALGQFLALRDLRLWFVSVILLAFVVLCGPFTPRHEGGLLFWMALIPSSLCGWLSLSDRGSLVAFWFPVVVWMLTILDRGQGALKFETGSAALLGGLAFVFIAFLYARETRRISLWRNVAARPIAPETVPVILKEVPRFRVGAAGWSLAISSAAFGICAWLAPRLWHVEPLVPDLYATRTERPDARPGGARCCQDIHINQQNRSRVKEYFDIGRGHDDDIEYKTSVEECVVCGPDGVPMDVAQYGYVDGYNYGTDHYYGNGEYYGNGTGRYGNGGGYNGSYNGNYYSNTPNRYDYNAPAPSYTAPQQYTAPTYTPPPEPTYTPPSTYTPPPPEVTPPPPPVVEPQVVQPQPPPEPIARQEAVPAAPMPTQPEVVRPPAPTQQPVAPTVAAPTTTTSQAPNAPSNALPFVTWILFILAGGFAFQMLFLSMRPLRRLVTLRHLRKPFWDETVDQRISNWWHLVLVGLRDAGWRTTTGEAPRELAKRLDIAGVEQAAAILDRARHGVGIDQDDLTKMEEASEQAYRASRDRASAVARFLGWFRRPLV